MAVPKKTKKRTEVVHWVGLNADREVVSVQDAARRDVNYTMTEPHAVSVPFSAVASISSCDCQFCFVVNGRLICICLC